MRFLLLLFTKNVRLLKKTPKCAPLSSELLESLSDTTTEGPQCPPNVEGPTAICLPFVQHFVHMQKLFEPFMYNNMNMVKRRRSIQMEQHQQYLQQERKIKMEKYIQQRGPN